MVARFSKKNDTPDPEPIQQDLDWNDLAGKFNITELKK